MGSVTALDRRYYANALDEHVLFDRMVAAHLEAGSLALDAGAGRGLRFPYEHRALGSRLVGVDLDPAVRHNPNVTHAAVADLASLPFEDGTFDLVFSKYVFEHLDRPLDVLRELRRVLKPSRHLLIHTPNRLHYVALVAAITPTWGHVWYRGKLGWEAADTFPTRYRVNDARTIARLATRSGFRVHSVVQIEGRPSYLAWHPVAYRLGIAYERIVNRFEATAPFRANLLVDLEAESAATTKP